jgi:protein ImuB
MPRRIIAAALPHLAAEARLRREGQAGFPHPFAIAGREGNALRLVSVNPAAAALGLAPDQSLADARAVCPTLVTRPAEPERLAAFRQGLARWAERFSPITRADETTLILDATGCAHLFGGEGPMLEAIALALAAHGLTARLAMADTVGAAWALAHYEAGFSAPDPKPTSRLSGAPPPAPPPRPTTDYPSVYHRWLGGEAGREVERRSPKVTGQAHITGGVGGGRYNIAPSGQTRAAIAALPVAALRLEPETAQGLAALGLATIGEAARIPRGALARRFGLAALRRLDQALGAEPEPVAPARTPPVFATRLTLPEPIGHLSDVMAGLDRLLQRLCRMLETHQMGARGLRLTARRVDGADTHAGIALARPGRDPARLAALFEPRLAELDSGFGIDALRLEATATEPLKPAQISRQTSRQPGSDSEKLADLLSRIGNRIGFDNVIRCLPADSHIPERAFTLAAAAWSEPEPFPLGGPPRPLVLFPPEKLGVERLQVAHALPNAPAPTASAPLPPGGGGMGRGGSAAPPPRFRWRRQWLTLAAAHGPERLAPEWWWDDPAWRSGLRDYWRVETAEGPRLWLFHTPQGDRPEWWAHGTFA